MEPTDHEHDQDRANATGGADGTQGARHARENAVSGRDEAVDHERQPGVPPPAAEQGVDGDREDQTSAESFPASDPPASY